MMLTYWAFLSAPVILIQGSHQLFFKKDLYYTVFIKPLGTLLKEVYFFARFLDKHLKRQNCKNYIRFFSKMT